MKRQDELNEAWCKYMGKCSTEILHALAFALRWCDEHPNWISVEEELPKINSNDSEWEFSGDVIVALKDGSIAVGRYELDKSIGEHYWVLYGVDKDLIVNYWMPAPPRGSSEKPNNCKKFGIKGYENVIIHEGNAKGGILKDAQGDDLPLQETPTKGGEQ